MNSVSCSALFAASTAYSGPVNWRRTSTSASLPMAMATRTAPSPTGACSAVPARLRNRRWAARQTPRPAPGAGHACGIGGIFSRSASFPSASRIAVSPPTPGLRPRTRRLLGFADPGCPVGELQHMNDHVGFRVLPGRRDGCGNASLTAVFSVWIFPSTLIDPEVSAIQKSATAWPCSPEYQRIPIHVTTPLRWPRRPALTFPRPTGAHRMNAVSCSALFAASTG